MRSKSKRGKCERVARDGDHNRALSWQGDDAVLLSSAWFSYSAEMVVSKANSICNPESRRKANNENDPVAKCIAAWVMHLMDNPRNTLPTYSVILISDEGVGG